MPKRLERLAVVCDLMYQRDQAILSGITTRIGALEVAKSQSTLTFSEEALGKESYRMQPQLSSSRFWLQSHLSALNIQIFSELAKRDVAQKNLSITFGKRSAINALLARNKQEKFIGNEEC